MTSIQEIKEIRLAKKAQLEEIGINPYPSRVNRTHTLDQVIANFDQLESEETEVSVVGRIMSLRGQGALAFVDLFDGTERFQALLKSDDNPEYIKTEEDSDELKTDLNGFDLFKETIDEGDFIAVTGKVFTTQRGQKTVAVSGWNIVAKSLRPIPDEFYGLKDEDERYRQRYIDILLNEETRKIVERKSIFWNAFRDYLLKQDFVEVQTPVLENTAGGAEAKPFITHHNALDIDVYLRISCGELWQKKLMVAGMPRVFEIGRIFRNEGMSATHLQDYTQIEFYQAYSDYREGMKMVTEMYREVAQKTFGTTEFEINGEKVDLNNEWEIYNFSEIIEERFGINLETEIYNKTGQRVIESDLMEICDSAGIEYEKSEFNIIRTVDNLWKSIRKEFTGPGFLIGIPVYMEPLAKKDPKNEKTVERFQIILGGTELGKGFSELNDPVDQESRFDHQESLREAGDDEAQMKDNEYVEAMEYGMPPTFGFGTSERMFSVLNGTSVRETTIFPMMRPKED
jgi:lysyl-tRNA synthetase class 2